MGARVGDGVLLGPPAAPAIVVSRSDVVCGFRSASTCATLSVPGPPRAAVARSVEAVGIVVGKGVL